MARKQVSLLWSGAALGALWAMSACGSNGEPSVVHQGGEAGIGTGGIAGGRPSDFGGGAGNGGGGSMAPGSGWAGAGGDGNFGAGGCPNGASEIVVTWTGSNFPVPDGTPVHGFLLGMSGTPETRDTLVAGGAFHLTVGMKTSNACSVTGPAGSYTLLYVDTDNSGTCSRSIDYAFVRLASNDPVSVDFSVSPAAGPRGDPNNQAETKAFARCGP